MLILKSVRQLRNSISNKIVQHLRKFWRIFFARQAQFCVSRTGPKCGIHFHWHVCFIVTRALSITVITKGPSVVRMIRLWCLTPVLGWGESLHADLVHARWLYTQSLSSYFDRISFQLGIAYGKSSIKPPPLK